MSSANSHPVAEVLEHITDSPANVVVSLSNELVVLLSEQLYQSPTKSIEELVVNAYDADAQQCRVSIPDTSESTRKDYTDFIAIFDNGAGMDSDGLSNLWQIGRSNKREDETAKRFNRKQIGRFGIGKLATYSVGDSFTFSRS